jgi:hypothetical protein
MGMGCAEDEYAARAKRCIGWLSGLFRESILLVGDGLGVVLDEISFDSEIRLGEADYEIAAKLRRTGRIRASCARSTGSLG